MKTYKQWKKESLLYTGTVSYWPFSSTLFLTDGTKHMLDCFNCNWLFTNIDIYDYYIDKLGFVVYNIVSDGEKATIEITDGNYNSQTTIPIQKTDLPKGEYKLFASTQYDENDEKYYIVYYPSEH